MKKAAFSLIAVFLAIIICELGVHRLYALIKGKFVWQREEFRVRDFT